MKEVKYLNRIADKSLELRLEAFGAVQVASPKWCGKTTTAERRAESVIKMQDPDDRAFFKGNQRNCSGKPLSVSSLRNIHSRCPSHNHLSKPENC